MCALNIPNTDELAARAKEELASLDYPRPHWVPETQHDGQDVKNVLIIGGGQGGLAIAHGLKQAKIHNVAIVDQADKTKTGIWNKIARNETLRTPKHLTGPAAGVPSLTPRAWYTAKYGAQAWNDLKKWPVTDWQDYLSWFQNTTDIPVQYQTKVTAIEPTRQDTQSPVKVTLETQTGLKEIFARKVVLATGIEASGHWFIPDIISKNLPKDLYHHTSEEIDFNALRGKRIGVIGAGASAFDNAATALEHGAASVDLLVRRKQIPVDNPFLWIEKYGILDAFNRLADQDKWAITNHLWKTKQPPPQETFSRCAKHRNFDIHTDCPVQDVAVQDGMVMVQTPHGTHAFDHLILGTGFVIDFKARPELDAFSDNIATWGDRYTPQTGEENAALSSCPYLGSGFEFLEKDAGKTPWISNVLNFTITAAPSMGLSGANITGMPFGAKHLVSGIVSSLLQEDVGAHLNSLKIANVTELVDQRLAKHTPI